MFARWGWCNIGFSCVGVVVLVSLGWGGVLWVGLWWVGLGLGWVLGLGRSVLGFGFGGWLGVWWLVLLVCGFGLMGFVVGLVWLVWLVC